MPTSSTTTECIVCPFLPAFRDSHLLLLLLLLVLLLLLLLLVLLLLILLLLLLLLASRPHAFSLNMWLSYTFIAHADVTNSTLPF
jgi:hypothetical protein